MDRPTPAAIEAALRVLLDEKSRFVRRTEVAEGRAMRARQSGRSAAVFEARAQQLHEAAEDLRSFIAWVEGVRDA